jgi:hypothetical protein
VTLSSGSTLQLSVANSNAGSLGAPAPADYSELTLGAGVLASITVLAIAGFALVIVSAFWHVLALLLILAVGMAVALWFWRKNHPKR